MEILNAARMRECELITVNKAGIPFEILMERAGMALFGECMDKLTPDHRILILAGKGNNGGDGFVAARLFHSAGYHVEVFLVYPENELSELAFHQLHTFNMLEGKVLKPAPANPLPVLNDYDIIIDCIFGTGLKKPVEGFPAEIIQAVNHADAFKLAADLPSGLDASSSRAVGPIFRADRTVTFGRGKICHYLSPAKQFCGEVSIVDIGIPDKAVEAVCKDLYVLTAYNNPPLPVRKKDGHKNDYGHVAVIGGSDGKTGAPVMASLAALRSGAGLVSCGIPECGRSALASHPELMAFYGQKDTEFTSEDITPVLEFCQNKTVVAIGPGCGRSKETAVFIREIIRNTICPIVVDADALYALDRESLSCLENRGVLTPHIGEFSALISVDKESLQGNELEMAKEYAARNKVYLMLKSAETIISTPANVQYISEWGTPALSKGGSGDILTGITAALMGQKYPPDEACRLACYMQGRASLEAARMYQEYAVLPTDILNAIGRKAETTDGF